MGGEDGEHCGKSFAVDYAVGIDDGFVEGIPACSVVRVASERVVEADHLRHYAFGEELGVFLVKLLGFWGVEEYGQHILAETGWGLG